MSKAHLVSFLNPQQGFYQHFLSTFIICNFVAHFKYFAIFFTSSIAFIFLWAVPSRVCLREGSGQRHQAVQLCLQFSEAPFLSGGEEVTSCSREEGTLDCGKLDQICCRYHHSSIQWEVRSSSAVSSLSQCIAVAISLVSCGKWEAHHSVKWEGMHCKCHYCFVWWETRNLPRVSTVRAREHPNCHCYGVLWGMGDPIMSNRICSFAIVIAVLCKGTHHFRNWDKSIETGITVMLIGTMKIGPCVYHIVVQVLGTNHCCK